MKNAIEGLWEELHLQYKTNNKPIPFHFKENAIKYLGESRSSPVKTAHGLYKYSGRIYPYIPLFLLSIKSLCPSRGKVLDPFAGSGTILLESIINPVYPRSALGIEINPIGRLISKVKTTPLDSKIINEKRILILKEFQNQEISSLILPQSNQFNFWYSQIGLQELAKMKKCIENLEENDYKDFFWLIFVTLARKLSRADPFIPPAVLLKPYKYQKSPKKIKKIEEAVKNSENPDLIKEFNDLVDSNLIKLEYLQKFPKIKNREKKVEIVWNDAREMRIGHYLCA